MFFKTPTSRSRQSISSVAQSQEAYALETERIEKRYNAALERYTTLETKPFLRYAVFEALRRRVAESFMCTRASTYGALDMRGEI